MVAQDKHWRPLIVFCATCTVAQWAEVSTLQGEGSANEYDSLVLGTNRGRMAIWAGRLRMHSHTRLALTPQHHAFIVGGGSRAHV